MTPSEFVAFAEAMKALGALEVQAGGYRCTFAPASLQRPATQRKDEEDVSPSRRELADARRARERGAR